MVFMLSLVMAYHLPVRCLVLVAYACSLPRTLLTNLIVAVSAAGIVIIVHIDETIVDGETWMTTESFPVTQLLTRFLTVDTD